MMSPRDWILSAVVCSACWACGARPDPPGRAAAVEPSGVTVLESQPRAADEVEPPAQSPAEVPPAEVPVVAEQPPAVDAGVEPAPVEGEPASAGGQVLSACLRNGENCTVLNVAVLDEAAGSCLELSIDNCGTFTRAGIPVDTPATWRLGSASIGEVDEVCVPAVYDPDSAIIVDGSGRISWNLDTRRPSDLVLDVSLEAAISAGLEPIAVAGSIAGEIPDCEG